MAREDMSIDSPADRSDEISISELFEIVRRYAGVVAVAMVAVAVPTWWLLEQRPDAFTSQARLLATQPDPAITQLSSSVATARPLDGTAYRSAALSRPLLAAASESLTQAGHPPFDLTDLDGQLTVTSSEARLSLQLTVAVQSSDPELAAVKANAIANALVRWDADRASASVGRVTEALGRQMADVDAQISAYAAEGDDAMVAVLSGIRAEAERNATAARLAATTIAGNLEVLEPAIAADEPDPTRAGLIAILAAIVTGFGLLVVALLREALRNTLGGMDGIANLSRKPVLGSFPIDPSGSRRLPPEAAGYLRSNLQFLVPPDFPLVLLITSGVAGEGKTSVAAALAEAYARSDYRTAVIDADGRRPKLTSTLRAAGDGRHDWLVNGAPNPDAAVTIAIGRTRSLDVYGLSTPLSGEDCRFIGRAFGQMIERLRDRYDVIVVDSAPVLPVADTLSLAPLVSAVINVISLKEATRQSLRDTLGVLDRVGANVVGVVATHAPRKRSRASGSYGYGYGYGDELGEETAGPRTSPPTTSQSATNEHGPHGSPPRERRREANSDRVGHDGRKKDVGSDEVPLIDDAHVPNDWRGQGSRRSTD